MIGRITMGNLYIVVFWDDLRKQADVYDRSRGGTEHVDTISVSNKEDPLALIAKVIEYGERLGLTVDEIAI